MRISSKWLPLIVLSIFFWGCPGQPEATEEPAVTEEHSEAAEEEAHMDADHSEGSGTVDASAEETEGGQENPEEE